MKALIVAYSKNKVIGINGKMPWYIPEELERFKKLTTGNIIIMGRLTHKDIGKVLPERINIIISKTENFTSKNCYSVSSLEDALCLADNIAYNKDIFIIGGETLFKSAIEFVDKMYITEIDKEFLGDRFFPDFDKSKFKVEIEKEIKDKISYRYLIYTRK